jgi:hypothetical protein
MTALDDDVAGAVADLGERRTTGRVVLELSGLPSGAIY